MATEDQTCALVLAALEATLAEPPPGGLPDPLAAHISGCALCRGRLLLLLHGLAAAQAGDPTRCAATRADMAAYLELEGRDPAAACGAYPDVWRHLWRCPGCLEDYELARALIEAAAAGDIPPLGLPARAPRPAPPLPLTRIVLSPHALDMALPLRRQAAALRGDGESVFVLFDGSEGDPPRQLTIVVREVAASTWDLQVTAEPPLAGVLLMSIGVQNFAGRFREDGSATIAGIPAVALTDPDSPALEIAILPYDG